MKASTRKRAALRLDPGHPDAPWTPEDCYPLGPRLCPCGHHEGYHAHNGTCRWDAECQCAGLPVEAYTPIPGRPLPRRYLR